MSGRVEMQDDGITGLVHGDSGRDYYATVDGFCECPDAERIARCKHALSVSISAQLAAVAKARAAQDDRTDLRASYAKLTKRAPGTRAERSSDLASDPLTIRSTSSATS